MFSTVLSTVTGQLDKRFLLNAFFPVSVALLALTAMVVTALTSITSAASWWTGQPALIQVLLAIAGVGTVFVAANALANNMLWITGLFEGYAIPRVIGDCGRRHYLSKFAGLSGDDESDVESKRNEYPLDPSPPTIKEMLPTRLGNLLRNGESYPLARYGVDAVRVWPRLYHIIPDSMRSSMNDVRASMESALAISFLAGLFAPVSAIFLLLTDTVVVWVLVVLWGSLAISAVAYQSALPAAAAYRDHIRAAFDLHRLELLSQMQMPMPVTAREERAVWAHVVEFLGSGEPHDQRYVRSA